MKKAKKAPLTTEEKAWLKNLRKVLKDCPSTRFGAQVFGEPELLLFDNLAQDEWEDSYPDTYKLSRHDRIETAGTKITTLKLPFFIEFEM